MELSGDLPSGDFSQDFTLLIDPTLGFFFEKHHRGVCSEGFFDGDDQ